MDGNECEQTWLYHRGLWKLVNDPTVPEELGETYQDYFDFLCKNGFKEHWIFSEWWGRRNRLYHIPFHL